MMEPFNWTCPFCGRDTTIGENNFRSSYSILNINNKNQFKKAITEFIVCPNPECGEYSLTLNLYNTKELVNPYGKLIDWTTDELINKWRLMPSSESKSYPDYIPEAIRNDYLEACLIKDLSPKASATLSRRCLQGIIRDFWNIKNGKLVDEIKEIQDKTDSLTWDAIDAVRKIGNIGAHMEKDINLIIDVDPDEAATLIQLIEMLIESWYIEKHERELRLKKITGIQKSKQDIKKNGNK